jgi:hypothetical protein
MSRGCGISKSEINIGEIRISNHGGDIYSDVTMVSLNDGFYLAPTKNNGTSGS